MKKGDVMKLYFIKYKVILIELKIYFHISATIDDFINKLRA